MFDVVMDRSTNETLVLNEENSPQEQLNESSMKSLCNLCTDNFYEVFSFLEIEDILTCFLLNKHIHSTLNQDHIFEIICMQFAKDVNYVVDDIKSFVKKDKVKRKCSFKELLVQYVKEYNKFVTETFSEEVKAVCRTYFSNSGRYGCIFHLYVRSRILNFIAIRTNSRIESDVINGKIVESCFVVREVYRGIMPKKDTLVVRNYEKRKYEKDSEKNFEILEKKSRHNLISNSEIGSSRMMFHFPISKNQWGFPIRCDFSAYKVLVMKDNEEITFRDLRKAKAKKGANNESETSQKKEKDRTCTLL